MVFGARHAVTLAEAGSWNFSYCGLMHISQLIFLQFEVIILCTTIKAVLTTV